MRKIALIFLAASSIVCALASTDQAAAKKTPPPAPVAKVDPGVPTTPQQWVERWTTYGLAQLTKDGLALHRHDDSVLEKGPVILATNITDPLYLNKQDAGDGYPLKMQEDSGGKQTAAPLPRSDGKTLSDLDLRQITAAYSQAVKLAALNKASSASKASAPMPDVVDPGDSAAYSWGREEYLGAPWGSPAWILWEVRNAMFMGFGQLVNAFWQYDVTPIGYTVCWFWQAPCAMMQYLWSSSSQWRIQFGLMFANIPGWYIKVITKSNP